MKKLYNKITAGFVGIFCLVFFQACEIDAVPTDRYTDEIIWNEPSSIELYLNNLYGTVFRTFQFGTFPVGTNNATDALTDIYKYTSISSGDGTVNILATDASRFNAASPGLSYWGSGYTRIRRVNEFLDGLHKYGQVDDDQKKVYEAEARFIRGYVYFWLLRLHGSVILMDELEDHTKKDMPRSSEDEGWNFAVADFQFAADALPEEWPASLDGKATRGAALSMLARTWLYAASIAEYDRGQFNQDPLTGVPSEKAREYYGNAVTAAEAVVDGGQYDLETDFANIFQTKNNKESIFRIDFVTQLLTHQYDLGFAPPRDNPGQTLVYGVPTAELVNEFEMDNGAHFDWNNPTMAANPYANREPRFYATILHNGSSWKGRTLNTTIDDAVEGFVPYGSTASPKRTVTGYYAKKMLDPDNTTFVQNRSTQSWHEIRYAEVLLILAEAKAMTGDITGAREALNTLRNKRDLPNSPANNQTQLLEAVEHERIIELALEGHRFWDLRRWRKAHTVLNNTRFTGHRISTVGGALYYEPVNVDDRDREFRPAQYYLPIIDTEVQRNDLLDQIDGW